MECMFRCRFQVMAAGQAALLAILLSAMAVQQASAQPAQRPAERPAAAATLRAGTELRIVEDDQVRIEETRVRGQLQRITVANKGSAMRPYEINVGAGGRDPSQDKSAAGQRVWSVLRF